MPVYTPRWSNLSEIAREEMQDRVDSAWLNSGKGQQNLHTGRLRAQIQRLNFLYTILYRMYPFRVPAIDK